MKMNFKSGIAIAGAVGFLLSASPASAGEKGKAAKATGEEVHCGGVNSCKGKGSCHGADNACKAQNSCKGKGWEDMSAKDCKAKGGKVIKS